ncbi:MAG: hypothetical protein L6R30_13880 [Thermoanaerobaculia bacterium]|nr:hypothetical protein [Thermoanaerobaculia bacterium]
MALSVAQRFSSFGYSTTTRLGRSETGVSVSFHSLEFDVSKAIPESEAAPSTQRRYFPSCTYSWAAKWVQIVSAHS